MDVFISMPLRDVTFQEAIWIRKQNEERQTQEWNNLSDNESDDSD